MAGLVAEENARTQDAESCSLFDSSEKECIVGHEAPAFQGIHCALVRGGALRSVTMEKRFSGPADMPGVRVVNDAAKPSAIGTDV